MKEENILYLLPEIINKSKIKAQEIINEKSILGFNEEFISRENFCNYEENNYLYHSDNINTMINLLNKGYRGKIDLIYIDPPFFTLTDYKGRIELLNGVNKEVIEHYAYNDKWKNGFSEYLEMLTIRLFLMKELLSEKGTIYVHLDFRTVHYVKIIMDHIFGIDNFLNEVIWSYKSGGTSSKYFSRKHDNILVYSKTGKYIFNPQKEKSYNRGHKPYRFKGVKEYEDELGWYTMVNLKDVWQIDIVGRTSRERVGYGTQKPEALLERIILSSSNEDSIVADFFAGSGTTPIVANRFNRKWIASDIGSLSIVTIKKRLANNNSRSYTVLNNPLLKSICEIDLNIKNKTKLDNKKYLIELELGKYDLDIMALNIDNKYKEIIEDIAKHQSLNLIDYLGIGVLPFGETPIIMQEYYRNANKLRIDHYINIKLDEGFINMPLYIKIIDVFGNVSIKVLEKY